MSRRTKWVLHAQILLSHERYQDYHLRFFNSINSMSNTLPSKYERDAKWSEVYMPMFHNSCLCTWFQYCVVDFKMKWSLSGWVVPLWKPWPVISLLNAVRWQLLSEDWNALISQTNPKQNPKLLTQMLPHSLIFQIREKKTGLTSTGERLGGEKRGCGSNDEGNHFIPILPAQIFLTREITELQI